jgi:hypothetical protein
VSAQQSTVADSLNALAAQRSADSAAIEQALGNLVIDVPETAAPAAVVAAATARTSRPAAAAAKKPAGVFTQTKGTRAGLNFRLSGNTRLYESSKGKGDYGKKAGTRIARSTPKPAAKPKPKPKPKAKAKARPKPKASPSRRPATTPRAPARKKRR